MEASGAMWMRVGEDGPSGLEARIRAAHRETIQAKQVWFGPLGVLAFDPAKHAFALVDRWGKSDDMPSWTEKLERLAGFSKIAELVALYTIEEGSEFGLYVHARDGAVVRVLERGDGQWLRVEGEPQPWEAPLLAPEALADEVRWAGEEGIDEALVRAEHGPIAKGKRWPSPRAVGQAIWKGVRAPLWGFAPWPKRRDVLKKIASELG